jgi:hypothetical protein
MGWLFLVRFDFYKKIIKLNFFFKKNQNQTEACLNWPVSIWFGSDF